MCYYFKVRYLIFSSIVYNIHTRCNFIYLFYCSFLRILVTFFSILHSLCVPLTVWHLRSLNTNLHMVIRIDLLCLCVPNVIRCRQQTNTQNVKKMSLAFDYLHVFRMIDFKWQFHQNTLHSAYRATDFVYVWDGNLFVFSSVYRWLDCWRLV